MAKKGSCDASPADLQASWWYNWNLNQSSTRDLQYVAIKQQPYWPGLNQDWRALGVNHLLGYNEPNNPVEDAYKNLNPPGSVSDAVARWPELLGTGLRVGAPGVSDSGYSWIVNFVSQAEAAGYRIDFGSHHAEQPAADAHRARKVGTGDRLVGAHQVQHDLAVDFARGTALGDLEPRGVDASHRAPINLKLKQNRSDLLLSQAFSWAQLGGVEGLAGEYCRGD